VRGLQFKTLHTLFEEQYQELADAVDAIAERILIKGHRAPATFKEFEKLKTIKDGDSSIKASEMVSQLAYDNDTLVKDLNAAMRMAQEVADEGTANLLSNRIEAHEKARWMLDASQNY
jgi:starvation-inducible DNA-binding protein